jgi:transcription elongation factor GreA-like protein
MVRYFNDQMASADRSGDIVISSYMLINELRNGKYHLSFIQPSTDVTFADLYRNLPDKVATFKAIKDSELNKTFIDGVVDVDPENWQTVLLKLFPTTSPAIFPRRSENRESRKSCCNCSRTARTAIRKIQRHSSTSFGHTTRNNGIRREFPMKSCC